VVAVVFICGLPDVLINEYLFIYFIFVGVAKDKTKEEENSQRCGKLSICPDYPRRATPTQFFM